MEPHEVAREARVAPGLVLVVLDDARALVVLLLAVAHEEAEELVREAAGAGVLVKWSPATGEGADLLEEQGKEEEVPGKERRPRGLVQWLVATAIGWAKSAQGRICWIRGFGCW